jgi:hypothetical protein
LISKFAERLRYAQDAAIRSPAYHPSRCASMGRA